MRIVEMVRLSESPFETPAAPAPQGEGDGGDDGKHKVNASS
jgi:hypothetical protein